MKKFTLKYTLWFVICALGVYSLFFLKHHSFAYVIDGYYQHYRAIRYYGAFLREIAQNLFATGKLLIPQWDFSIGEGADILTNFHYYGIGDPLLWLSAFIPVKYLSYFYDGVSLFRLYLSGIAFYVYCREIGYKNDRNILLGALSYAFGFWGMLSVARHPFFVWPLVYFPLLLTGMERIRKKGSSKLFVLAVMFTAFTNFYWLYMLAFLCAIYMVVRIIFELRGKTKPKELAGWVFAMAVRAVIGVLPAMVILFPVLLYMMGSGRSSGGSVSLFYSLNYYIRTGFDLIADYDNIDWRLLGFSLPAILAIVLVFLRKTSLRLRYLRTFLVMCVVIMMVPFFGKVLNGFAYATNRWCFSFLFVACIALVEVAEAFEDLSQKEWKRLLILVGLFGVYLMGVNLIIKNTYAVALYVLLFALTLCLSPKAEFLKNKRWHISFGVAVVGIILLGINKFSFYVDHSSLERSELEAGVTQNEASVLAEYKEETHDEEFSRYTSHQDRKNNGIAFDLSSTEFYWSLTNAAVSEFRKITEQFEYRDYEYSGYDDSAIYEGLDAVKYYVLKSSDANGAPYGYSYCTTKTITQGPAAGEYEIYENDYALPLAYTYDSQMSRSEFEKLSVTQKMEAMLCNAILEDDVDVLPRSEMNYDSVALDSSMTLTEGDAKITEDAISVKATKSKTQLQFDNAPTEDSEIWVEWKGLNYQQDFDRSSLSKLGHRVDEISVKFNITDDRSKKLYFYSSNHPYYWGREDFAVNLGTLGTEQDSIGLKLYELGDYTFDSLEVWALPMTNYGERIAALKEYTLENLSVENDNVSGRISLDEKRLLCFAIPYSSGWKAYVDGKETQVYQTNIKNLGVVLSPGEHQVVLQYETPGWKTGKLLALFGVAAMILLFALSQKKKRKSN